MGHYHLVHNLCFPIPNNDIVVGKGSLRQLDVMTPYQLELIFNFHLSMVTCNHVYNE